ncbi:MAG: hypothetical protein VKJ64_01395 [Leptolyngbyaceae bacterium]|nr:hypothetical protein [Leptolyngbyaceae bacterium]
MSTIAERAIQFYLTHSEVVDSMDVESNQRQSHQIHTCPECRTSLVVKGGELESVGESLGIIPDAPPDSSLSIKSRYVDGDSDARCWDSEKLVPC